jgi:hypothetical protein
VIWMLRFLYCVLGFAVGVIVLIFGGVNYYFNVLEPQLSAREYGERYGFEGLHVYPLDADTANSLDWETTAVSPDGVLTAMLEPNSDGSFEYAAAISVYRDGLFGNPNLLDEITTEGGSDGYYFTGLAWIDNDTLAIQQSKEFTTSNGNWFIWKWREGQTFTDEELQEKLIAAGLVGGPALLTVLVLVGLEQLIRRIVRLVRSYRVRPKPKPAAVGWSADQVSVISGQEDREDK